MKHQAIRMIAPVAVGDGNTTVKSPAVLVLSPPKSTTAIALLELVLLYKSIPLLVMVAVEKVWSLKSHTQTEPDKVGVTLVSEPPPEL